MWFPMAYDAAAVRERPSTCRRCCSHDRCTMRSLRNSSVAIAWFVLPAATSLSASTSRALRPWEPTGCDGCNNVWGHSATAAGAAPARCRRPTRSTACVEVLGHSLVTARAAHPRGDAVGMEVHDRPRCRETGFQPSREKLEARVRRCAVSCCRVACHPRAGRVIVSKPVRSTGPIQTAQPESLDAVNERLKEETANEDTPNRLFAGVG